MIKKKKRLLWIPVAVLGMAAVGVGVGFAAWQAITVANSNNGGEEALYTIKYHGCDIDDVEGLELTSGFDLAELPTNQADLLAGRFYFAGWKVGNSTAAVGSTVFSNMVSHTAYDLSHDYSGALSADNTIHLWPSWSTSVKNTDVVLDVTYQSTLQYRTIVPATSRFFLFNINLPSLGDSEYVSGYRYENPSTHAITDYVVNDYLDFTTDAIFAELGSGQSRIIPLVATIATIV